MHPWLDAPVLDGSLVRLEPLAVEHANDLARAAEEDRSSYAFALVPRADKVGDYLQAQFDRVADGLVPFAQIRQSDGRAVGCTAYWGETDAEHRRGRVAEVTHRGTWIALSMMDMRELDEWVTLAAKLDVTDRVHRPSTFRRFSPLA